MSKLLKLITLLGLALLVMACSDDDSPVTPSVVHVTGVTLNVQNVSLAIGAKETLKVNVTPEDATNKRVSWSSSKTEVASVDAQGIVTAHKAGETVVTVKTEDGGKTATCKVTVKDGKVAVTGVKLDKTAHTLAVGGTVTLVATVTPEGATNKKVTWKSDKKDIATVDGNGKVTAVKEGEAKITVTTEDGNKTATCTITVKKDKVAVTGVKLDKTAHTLTVGGTVTLVATVTPEGATNKKVTWKSDKKDIATVDGNGKVTAVKEGEAKITVTTEDGNKTATCTITVKKDKVAVTGVKLDKTAHTLTVGGTVTLVATVTPEGATNKKVTWKSDKTDIATVDGNGKVTAVKEGEAKITVTTEDGNKTATCTITVKKDKVAVTGVSLNKTDLSMTVGGSFQFVATITPKDATNKNVKWQSNDSGVAQVDGNGKVTAKAVGTATITVITEDGNKTASCKVTVQEDKVAVTGVKLNVTSLSMMEGDSYQLIATIAPINATNQNVKWQSSNSGVAQVNGKGEVRAINAGTATITVITEDGNKTASCSVTVKANTIAVASVSLNKSSLSLVVGDMETLAATLSPANATNKTVKWSSSDPYVAQVNSYGEVRAINAGTATITVTTEDGHKTASCKVTVKANTIAVASVSLNKSSISLKVGDKETLVATLSPANATNKAVKWSSSDLSVAEVNSNGVVTAKGGGTAIITVTTEDGHKTASCVVSVEKPTDSINAEGYEDIGRW